MRTVLVFSGGLDSTTLLYQLLSQGDEVRCISFDYAQRHAKELAGAFEVCQNLRVTHRIVGMRDLGELLGSALGDPKVEVPDGHYTEEAMKLTVVPNRNMIMLSVAIGWAVASKFDQVAYAAHGGDHAIYPDCRPEFVAQIDAAATICDWHSVRVVAPFIALSKGDIVKAGLKLGVPYEKTWTCYKGRYKACGLCGSCVERLEAFALAGAADPLEYEEG